MKISAIAETLIRSVSGKKKRQESIFLFVIFCCWTAINLWVAFRYEPWCDVTQAWMIARQCNLSDLFAQLQREGHPFLWYFVLMPFAKAGLPCYFVIVVSFAFMFFVVRRFLATAPLSLFGKFIVVFSAMCMYYLPIESRSYSMIPLFWMLLYAAYPNRHTHSIRYAVILFLLCQTHVLLCAPVGMLMLFWAIEAIPVWRKKAAGRGKLAGSLAIMVAAVALLYWQLHGSADLGQINVVEEFPTLYSLFEKPFGFLTRGTDVISIVYLNAGYSARWITIALLLLVIAMITVFILWLVRAPKSALTAFAAILWYAFVHIFVYPVTSMRFVVTLIWTVLFCLFLAKTEMAQRPGTRFKMLDRWIVRILLGAVLAFCLVSCIQTYTDIADEIQYPNNESKVTAAYLNTQLPDDAIVMIENEVLACTVAAWCPNVTFDNPIRQNDHVYSMIDEYRENWCVRGDLDAEITRLSAAGIHGDLYLLAILASETDALAMSNRSNAKLVEIARFTDDRVLRVGEQYILYRILTAP